MQGATFCAYFFQAQRPILHKSFETFKFIWKDIERLP